MLAAITLFLVGTAHGDAPGRVTFGDVNSLFNSFGPALNFVSGNHPANPSITVAAPADGWARGRIFPFDNGQPISVHCENDWAVVNLFVTNFQDASSRKDAAEGIAGWEIDYELDGESVESMRTPLRGAMLDPTDNKTRVWFVSDGFFVEPGSLEVGFHMVQTYLTIDGSPIPLSPAVFEILPASHPDCS